MFGALRRIGEIVDEKRGRLEEARDDDLQREQPTTPLRRTLVVVGAEMRRLERRRRGEGELGPVRIAARSIVVVSGGRDDAIAAIRIHHMHVDVCGVGGIGDLLKNFQWKNEFS